MEKTLRIFAFGGNEVSPTGKVNQDTGQMKVPDLKEQWARAADTCELIADIIQSDPDNFYVITHGNGPQVGNILLRAEYASSILHPIPLDICVADSQGAMGYMLAQLSNSLQIRGIQRSVAGMVVEVEVDPDDPAFKSPTKFIGAAYTKTQAHRRATERGWKIKFYKVNDLGEEVWRRVVPSPIPTRILGIDMIEAAINGGIIPITVGGGGIPVKRVPPEIKSGKENYFCNYDISYSREIGGNKKDKDKVPLIYTGVEAVIDKDLSSALLGMKLQQRAARRGEELNCELTIFTDEDGAKINYQKPDQEDITYIRVGELKKLYEAGSFPEGSMGPKIKALINFIEGGGKRGYISKVELFEKTLKGDAGTTVVP